MIGDWVLRPHGAGDDEPDIALLEHVGGGITGAGLGTPIPDDAEAELGTEKLSRLEGVADPPLQMGEADEREVVLLGHLLRSVEDILIRHCIAPCVLEVIVACRKALGITY